MMNYLRPLTNKQRKAALVAEYLADQFNKTHPVGTIIWHCGNLDYSNNAVYKSALVKPAVGFGSTIMLSLTNSYNKSKSSYNMQLACMCTEKFARQVLIDKPDWKLIDDSIYFKL